MVNAILRDAMHIGTLAQLVEQRTFNPLVAGSNPARPTIHHRYILEPRFTACTDHTVHTLGPNGLGPGSTRQLTLSKHPRSWHDHAP
jgi:hypothetical protein